MNDYVGTSMANPAQLIGGRCLVAEGERVIAESIADILGTSVGDSLLDCEYGSRLDSALHLPNDEVTWQIIRQIVFEAVGEWERRVKLINVNVVGEDTDSLIKCTIHISYKILSTNKTGALVYPFYKQLP
jgi:phage baseplate assembly protein W